MPRAWIASLALMAALAGGGALAAVPQSEFLAAGMPESLAPFAVALSQLESARDGWRARNEYDCVGFFQACDKTFKELYSGTYEQFLADRPGQVRAYLSYARSSWTQAQPYLGQLIGRTVSYGGREFTLDESAVLYGMQFGIGRTQAFLRGGCEAPAAGPGTWPAVDHSGVSVCRFFAKGAGYDVTAITGGTPPANPEPGVPPLVEGSPQQDPGWSPGLAASPDKQLLIERALIANRRLGMELAALERERRRDLLWSMLLLADLDALAKARTEAGADDAAPAVTPGTRERED